MIYERVNNRKRDFEGNAARTGAEYKSVVYEYPIPPIANPFTSIAKLLQRRRKLKPLVKKGDPVSYESKDRVDINLHIIKAENVPVRHDYLQEIRDRGAGGNDARRNPSF